MILEEIKTFVLSTIDEILKRVLDPIFIKATNKKFKHNSEFVKFFANISSVINKNFSQIKFLSFKKVNK